MNNVELRFLGLPRVLLNNQPVTFPTRKALALLIYIVLERRVHSREALMAMLWPESDTARAQASLRTTLAYLRKIFPVGYLTIDHDSVYFDLGRNIDLDMMGFEQAYEATFHLPLNQSALIPAFKRAAALVTGDFLSGFSLKDAPAFDDWAAAQRETCHQQATRLFETLSRLQLEAGAVMDSLEITTHWIRIAPLDENAYQRQMQLHLANGNRLAALQTYKTCCLMLLNEFGLRPSAETDILAQQAQMASVPSVHHGLDLEAECIALNRMATVAAQSTYDLDRALDLLRQALYLAKQLENPLHLAETQWNLSQTYFYMGHLESAFTHGEAAIAMARGLGRDDLLARALNTVAYVKLLSGRSVAEIIVYVDEALLLFNRLLQRPLEVDCLTLKSNAYLCHGCLPETVQYAEEALKISQEIQNDWGYAAAAYNLGFAYESMGDVDGALAICQKGLVRARLAGHPPLIFFNMLALGHVQRAAEELPLALQSHLEARRIADALKSPFFKMLILGELCADYVQLESWVDAIRCALEVQPLHACVPYLDFTRWAETEALLHVGDAAEAQ